MSVRTPGHGFKVKDRVARRGAESRRGLVIALGDDDPMLLVRWDGGRICDWVQAEQAVHVTGPGAGTQPEESSAENQ